jgi:hypothetical protein
MSNLNINQFAQVAVRGQQDLSIARSGVISGMVSAANGATPVDAGDFVDLDPANAIVGQPSFISAAATDVNFGNMVLDVKTASALTPNTIQVAARFHGPVVWLIAAGTIAPGALVEQSTVPANGDVVTFGTSTSKLRGVALDPGSLGNLMRVILVPAAA